MGSSCELLSCVYAPTASLHSCKVSSRTKRGISTRGTPALATWASEKARCGAGEARTLPCERAVCRCPRCACLLLAAPPALAHRLHALHAPLSCDNVYDRAVTHIRRCWCIRDVETYTWCVLLARWNPVDQPPERSCCAGREVSSGGDDARWGYTMHVVGGRGEWSLGEGAGGNKRWDGIPGRREEWCLGCGWDMVVVAYVGETVHVRASQLQAPKHRPQDLGQMS